MTATAQRAFAAPGARGTLVVRAIGFVTMVFALAYFALPVVWLVIASTKTAGDLYTTPGFAFAHWSFWTNIVELTSYENGIFWRWMLNSAVYSGLGALATTAVSALCGYALATYRFRGKSVLTGALYLSLLVPPAVLAQPTYLVLVGIGLNNTMLGVLLPTLVFPFGVLLSRATVVSSVPREIIEAARIDGANEFRIFGSIVTRLMTTGLATVLLFAFVGSWNSFVLPLLVLDDPTLYPVTVGLVDWSTQSRNVAELGTLTVIGSLMSAIPLILIFLVLQRYWKSGLTAGGVKF